LNIQGTDLQTAVANKGGSCRVLLGKEGAVERRGGMRGQWREGVE